MTPKEFLTQTSTPPFESDVDLNRYITVLKENNTVWDGIGVLIDETPKSIIFLLLNKQTIQASLRINFSTGQMINGVKALQATLSNVYYSVTQNYHITQTDLSSLIRLQSLWDEASAQRVLLSQVKIVNLFNRLENPNKEKQRGKEIPKKVAAEVISKAFGRCMFPGCAENLLLDHITGSSGNFSYLAHNIASSEKGPRGALFLSGLISDNPENILLLCDKHHRLVDKIAAPDYSAERLSKIRFDYLNTANKLLDSLSYEPVPVYSVLWPVQKNSVSAPSAFQINQSLNKLKWRMHESLNTLDDCSSILQDCNNEIAWHIYAQQIHTNASKILQQTASSCYKGALFAFGLMPALIGLGAKLGNKNEIYPMLRYRDGNQWVWPLDEPSKNKTYEILGLSSLINNKSKEVILSLAFTAASPSQFISFYETKPDCMSIEIKAKKEFLGNGAVGHPKDGVDFMNDMQKLLHRLKTEYGIEKVHVLPCASNAVCVFFGKAFDSNHPELIIYDFSDKSMIPCLSIKNIDNKCEVTSCHASFI